MICKIVIKYEAPVNLYEEAPANPRIKRGLARFGVAPPAPELKEGNRAKNVCP